MDLNKKLDVIFDTNVLRAEPYYKREEYNSLKILVDKNLVRVNLPKIVESEYFTQLEEPYNKKFKTTISTIKDLKKEIMIEKHEIEVIEDKIFELKKQSLNKLKDNFTSFFDDLKVERNTFKEHHAHNVFDRYFKGENPFKNKKERQDIPDAFIFEIIKDIKNENDNCVVLVKDNALIKACEEADIKYFKSLSEFIKTDEIQEALKIQENIEGLIKYLKENNYLTIYLEDQHIKDLNYVTIHDNELIKSDDNTAQISSQYYPNNIQCDYSTYTNFGNGNIGFSTTFDIEVNAYLNVFKSDYYSDSYFGNFSHVEELNDHYFTVEGTFLLSVELDLIVNYSKIKLSDDIENFEDVIDEIEIEINGINKITVEKDLSEKPKKLKYKCSSCGLENSISYEEFEHEFEGIEYDEKSHTDYTNMTHTKKCKCGTESKIKIDISASSYGYLCDYNIYIENGELVECNFFSKQDLYDNSWWYNN